MVLRRRQARSEYAGKDLDGTVDCGSDDTASVASTTEGASQASDVTSRDAASLTQIEDVPHSVDTARAHTTRARVQRFIFTFMLSDLLVSAYWLGASPRTYYMLYFFKVMCYGVVRVVEYRMAAYHYYLADFCYFANAMVMLFIWYAPTSGMLFSAIDGCCGMLLLGALIFQNACVLHDFSAMTSACLHFNPVIAILAMKTQCESSMCVGVSLSLVQALRSRFTSSFVLYAAWAVLYYLLVLGIFRRRIERKQRETSLGYFPKLLKDILPESVLAHSVVIYICVHCVLFLLGLSWLLLPLSAQVIAVLCTTIVFFHNGASSYIDKCSLV